MSEVRKDEKVNKTMNVHGLDPESAKTFLRGYSSWDTENYKSPHVTFYKEGLKVGSYNNKTKKLQVVIK